jgi:putative ABC transport system permease protein
MIRPGGLYVRVDDDADVEQTFALANHQIGEIMTERVNTGRGVPAGKQAFTYDVTLVPITEIHLGGKHAEGAMSTAEGMALVVLAVAALVLLAVSAFNYVTMSLARSMRRQREVAVRKVVGAAARRLRHTISPSRLW